MNEYARNHLTDQSLLSGLKEHLRRESASTAEVLADLSEVEERRIYLAAAYPSMSAWCEGELGLSRQAAFKRVRAARLAREFPRIFAAVADRQLHLSAVILLAGKITKENAGELIIAATQKSESEIAAYLAQRFGKKVAPATALALTADPLSSRRVESVATESPGLAEAGPPTALPHLAPLPITLSPKAHELLIYAQQLMSHELPSCQASQALEAILTFSVQQLEKRKFGATGKPRPGRRSRLDSRYIPLAVKRVVWARDGGRCTFTSATGKRCSAKERIEFDHIVEFSRGGQATAGNLRLRCQAHNQYEAERTYGVELMEHKRESAQRVAEARRQARAESESKPEIDCNLTGRAPCSEPERNRIATASEDELIPYLRKLGFSAADARCGAEACAAMRDETLEQRIKLALKVLLPPHRHVPAPGRAA